MYSKVVNQMGKVPKSFRFNPEDVKKLDKVHAYMKRTYSRNTSSDNMNNLHKWSEAQTISVLIRNKYQELVESGDIEPIED
jgi:hypothetical protein